jgi:hypothetical protein
VIGAKLGAIDVREKIGEGGMATVYRGCDTSLSRDVAIKVLHPHIAASGQNKLRFHKEANGVANLRHPNIVTVFGCSPPDADTLYFEMEFADAVPNTVGKLLWQRGRLPSEIVAMIGADVAGALAFAHHHRVLHRDVKPDNILLFASGLAKVTDFGIARFLDGTLVTLTGGFMGSPAYMSPEQARDEALDGRSDLFSLGSTLFQLVTGTVPFSGSNAAVILKHVAESKRPMVSELAPTLAPALADVIERLLAPRREDRYATADEVQTALYDVLAESGIDRRQEAWSLQRYLDTPEAWERALEAHLHVHLLAEGKARLARGDHLGALRLLNRLLSMAGEHAEVLALIGSLHGEAKPPRRTGRLIGAAAGLAVATVAALVGGWTWRGEPDAPPSVAVPSPASALPAPATVATVTPPAPVPVAALAPPAPPAALPAPRAPGPRAPVPAVQPPAPAAPLPPTPSGATRVALATLQLTTADALYGEVWSGSDRLGRVGDRLSLEPGVWAITVKSPLIQPVDLEIALAPGEQLVRPVVLQPKPWKFLLQGWDGSCSVVHNGAPLGTVEALSGQVVVSRPDQPQALLLRCRNAETPLRWRAGIAHDTVVRPP